MHRDHNKETLKSVINEKMDSLKIERRKGWENFRNENRFDFKQVKWEITMPGSKPREMKRFAYFPKEEYKLINTDVSLHLQQSRGVIGQEEKYNTYEDYDDNWDAKMKVSQIEKTRIYELEHAIKILDEIMERENLPPWKPTGYCDVGFKYPRLCKHYGETYGCKTLAVDFNELSVDLARYKGYDSRRVDLMSQEPYGLEGYNLITINHVLEHVPRPDLVIAKLSEECDDFTIIQIEVPIENDKPQLDFGHMFGFHSQDIAQLSITHGFTVLSNCHLNIANAYVVDRIHIVKVPEGVNF